MMTTPIHSSSFTAVQLQAPLPNEKRKSLFYLFIETIRDFSGKICDLGCLKLMIKRDEQKVSFQWNEEKIKNLIAKESDLNAIDAKGFAPLHFAAMQGDTDLAKLLIDNRANINCLNNQKQSPLLLASMNKRTELACLLIDKEADINLVGIKGETPLHWAAYDGDLRLAKLLIEKGTDLNAIDAKGLTPLHFAAIQGHTDLAKLLIDHGANINCLNSQKQSPLLLASMNQRTELACLVIDRGADVNAVDIKGEAPLHWAAYHGDLKTAKLLIEKGAVIDEKSHQHGYTALFETTFKDHIELARFLIEKGADVNITDKKGFTPLFSAVDKGNIELAGLLIEKGANINARAQRNVTPLVQASALGHSELVRFLIQQGADINVSLSTGFSLLAFILAERNKNWKEIAQILLEKDPEAIFFAKELNWRKLIGNAMEIPDLDDRTAFIKQGTTTITKEIMLAAGIPEYLWRKIVKGSEAFVSTFPHLISSNVLDLFKKAAKPVVEAQNRIAKDLFNQWQSGLPLFLHSFHKLPPNMSAIKDLAHAKSALLWNDQLIFCDRGVVGKKNYKVFKFDPKCLTESMLNSFINPDQLENNFWDPASTVLSKLNLYQTDLEKELENTVISNQISQNCSYAALEGIFFLFLILCACKEKATKAPISIKEITEIRQQQKTVFDQWRSFQKIFSLQKYIKRLITRTPIYKPDFHLLERALYLNFPYFKIDKKIVQMWEETEKQFLRIAPKHIRCDYLLKKRPSCFQSVAEEEIETTRLLIEKGANVDEIERLGMTPLHFAVTTDNIALVQLLLEQGAQIDAQDAAGNSPLFHAIEENRLAMTNFLLEQGANVNSIRPGKLSPLDNAIRKGNIEMVKLLVKKGARINIIDSTQISYLEYALYQKQYEIAKFLFQKGARAQAKNYGVSALHYAVQKNDLNAVKFLVENRAADLNAVNHLNETPLHFAAVNSQTDIVKYLLEQNANVHLFNQSGHSALSFVLSFKRNNWKEILKLFEEKDPTTVPIAKEFLSRKFIAAFADIKDKTDFLYRGKLIKLSLNEDYYPYLLRKLRKEMLHFGCEFPEFAAFITPELLEMIKQGSFWHKDKVLQQWRSGKPLFFSRNSENARSEIGLIWDDQLIICDLSEEKKPYLAFKFDKSRLNENSIELICKQEANKELWIDQLKTHLSCSQGTFENAFEKIPIPHKKVNHLGCGTVEGLLFAFLILYQYKSATESNSNFSKIVAAQQKLFDTWRAYVVVRALQTNLDRYIGKKSPYTPDYALIARAFYQNFPTARSHPLIIQKWNTLQETILKKL